MFSAKLLIFFNLKLKCKNSENVTFALAFGTDKTKGVT